MSLLQKLTDQQGYVKACFLGFPKSGKTYSASLLACVIHKHFKCEKPITMFDTEAGSPCVTGMVSELTEKYPLHVVCAWIGNTAKVAAGHYLQVTEKHFEDAAEILVQNEAQYSAVKGCNPQESETKENSEVDVLRDVTCKFIPLQYLRMGRAGFEPA